MLPELIEIIPPVMSGRARVTIPGSKSITNRALVLAALSAGTTRLRGALWSEDTQVMVEALRVLGFSVEVVPEAGEASNRTITVTGGGGRIPRGGTQERPLELQVGNAGTAARFLSALVCLGTGWYRLSGVARMHERPQAALIGALRSLGYRVDASGERLPAVIQGLGRRPGAECTVDVAESSQFASALLLCAGAGGWRVSVVGKAALDEAPYVTMTQRLVEGFPGSGGTYLIEPDASSGSYFWAADWLLRGGEGARSAAGHGVEVADWPASGLQIDAEFPRYLPLPGQLSRERHLGDSIMTAIVLAPWARGPVRFTELGRLRVQECERVVALRTELGRCGASVIESGDELRVTPGPLRGAEIETYNDHRMAMCFATLGLKVPGMKIKNPGCVRKTFPNFFQKLQAPPPAGLGAVIVDPRLGRPLAGVELDAG